MNTRTVALLAVLALMVASAASATSLTCLKTLNGDTTTYTYTLSSTEYGDYITSFHIYAPLATGLIQGYTAPAHWSFDAILDPEPDVGTDIYWFADDYDLYGIPNLSSRAFTLTVPSWTSTNDGHVVPGCWGNWGYETQSWPDAILISFPSVPVPEGVPEPTSLIALTLGCLITARARRRRVVL